MEEEEDEEVVVVVVVRETGDLSIDRYQDTRQIIVLACLPASMLNIHT